MRTLYVNEYDDIFGGKEVPGYGQPGGIPGPSGPTPLSAPGAGTINAILAAISLFQLFVDLIPKGGDAGEPIKSPEENNSP